MTRVRTGYAGITARQVAARRATAGLVAALALAGAGSCSSDPNTGYAFASSYRADVSSIAVPIFRNDTYSRGMEVELTEAVIAEIRRATPWTVTQGGSAQTTLSGTIVSSEMAKVSTQRDTGLVEEMALSMLVDFTWKDNRTGKPLVTRRGFQSVKSFIPARGTTDRINERLEVGQAATVQEMARRIVDELRSSW